MMDRRPPTFFGALGVSALVVACASGPAAPPATAGAAMAAIGSSGWAREVRIAGLAPLAPWTHQTYGDIKPTVYEPTALEGRPAIHAHSEAGNSTLRLRPDAEPGRVVSRLRFSWFVRALNEEVDLRDSDVDDAVARVILSFDGNSAARFALRDHLLSEIARLLTGEPMPYATLMYVWDNRYPVGTIIPNPHSARIMQVVVETGPRRLGQWVDIERDVVADFRQAFGEAPGRLVSVGLMTDANNTGARVDAWYGPLALETAPASAVHAAALPGSEAPPAKPAGD